MTKKIGNAFDNRIDAKRTLREIKLLRHMDHDNVSTITDLNSLNDSSYNSYVSSLFTFFLLATVIVYQQVFFPLIISWIFSICFIWLEEILALGHCKICFSFFVILSSRNIMPVTALGCIVHMIPISFLPWV